MPPLARQLTPQSVHSWWSDSNPPGATISLHAAAKPLMRLMYHRQAMRFIEDNFGIPLSQESLDIYVSYLAYKHLPDSTKAVVLKDITDRAVSEHDARKLADSVVLQSQLVNQLFQSVNGDVRRWMCELVERLADHESIRPSVLGGNTCGLLVSLLRDSVPDVVQQALHALACIAQSLSGAQAAIDAKILDLTNDLLDSPNAKLRMLTCQMLGHLSCHESPANAVLSVNPCRQLVSLLREDNADVVANAIYSLTSLAQWPYGALAAVEARILDQLPRVPYTDMESSLAALAVGLVSLLRSGNSHIIQTIVRSLSDIAQWDAGSRAIVEAGMLDMIQQLLESPDIPVRRWTWQMLKNVASHNDAGLSVATAHAGLLVESLCDDDDSVIQMALDVLDSFSQWPATGNTKAAAHPLVLLGRLVGSRATWVCEWTCEALGGLVSYGPTAVDIIKANPCRHIVRLLRAKRDTVVQSAVYALSELSRWSDGARAVIEAGALDVIDRMLEFPVLRIREWTCALLGNLASHDFTIGDILHANPCERLVSLVRFDDDDVSENALYALANLSRCADGAQAVIDAQILDLLVQLLDSPTPQMGQWMCELLGNLARHESTAPSVLETDSCLVLVSLLRSHLCSPPLSTMYATTPVHSATATSGDRSTVVISPLSYLSPSPSYRQTGNEDSYLVEGIVYALSKIALWDRGARALVHAEIMELLDTLLDYPATEVQDSACMLLGNFADHYFTEGVILAENPCEHLVSLVCDEDSDLTESVIRTLANIARRVDGALAVADTFFLDLLDTLLESPRPQIWRWTCEMVGNLARQESIADAVVHGTPWRSIVALLHNNDTDHVESAMFALESIARWSAGANAVINAGVLNVVDRLLQCSTTRVVDYTCAMLANLAHHESTSVTVLDANFTLRLVSLLRNDETSVIESALYTLSTVARWPEGAQGIVDAGALDLFEELFESSRTGIREWTCELLRKLAHHESASICILRFNPCGRVVSVLQDDTSSDVVQSAVAALEGIARCADGAQAVLDAGTLHHLPKLLASENIEVRHWTCRLLGTLALHGSTTARSSDLKPATRLVSLLRHTDITIRTGAVLALEKLSETPVGLMAIANTILLDHISEWNESTDLDVQLKMRSIVARLDGVRVLSF